MQDLQSAASGPELQDAGPVGSINRSQPQGGKVLTILSLLWVKRRTVLRIVVAGTLLSALYAFLLPNRYTSTTSLMPPESASSNSTLMSLLSAYAPVASAGSAMLGAKTPGALFTGILASREVQESLVRRFGLVRYYKVHFPEDACKRLASDSSITENTRTGIISISVTAKDPSLASKIAQGYVAELDRVVTNNSTSAARRERIFLEGRLKEIKQDLDGSAKALSQFSAKNRTIDIPSQGKAMVESGLKLQDQMVAARSELAGLRQSYSEDNVRILAARARVAELRRQIDKTMGSPEEPKLDANGSTYPSVSELPALALTYSDLERKVRVEEVLWDSLTQQYEYAKVQEAKEIPTVRVLDAANLPQRKSGPARLSIVISGMVLFHFFATCYVLALSFWEGLNADDDRKKLLTEIGRTMWVSRRTITHVLVRKKSDVLSNNHEISE